ncbi:uncharacterized protein YbjT (DUF2867 family) [Granulicella aggregans]|uniref:Uncharacterized protein YbjT (DUF2867 family) n=1 Tax=Granulicella aggregans TaxID=474949 RepID=A0A7W7ZHS5_9BACT|nr:NAD(P)H-binding protein [Granulicella aggregans]MBB5060160.1 uncharacterized protein YbjT (DUF2867 family) [Granulicella aggregans]
MNLVTGATGNVGSNVVDQLLAEGEQVRVFTRDKAKVAHWGGRVQVALGDFTKPETYAEAVSGVDGIFVMNIVTPIDSFRQFLETAKANGTPRIVFLSSLSAADPVNLVGKLHLEKEEAIRASGLPYALLRCGGFMSNAFGWLQTIKSESTVYNPMGSGQYAPIAPEDIAAVAVRSLRSPHLSAETYNLTGSQLIDAPQQVEILSRLIHRPLRVVDITTETAVENMVRYGIPAPIATGVAKSFESIREGKAAMATNTVAQLTGRPPLTFEGWAARHVDKFA